MKKEPLLTICVPTYNRDRMLDKCLSRLYDIQQKGYLFRVVVGNNGSFDTTDQIISYWSKQFDDFRVINHKHNIGYDRNAGLLYSSVQTKYCWMLGDCDSISSEHFGVLLKYLEGDIDALIINTEAVVLGTELRVYTELKDFLNEQLWHITKLSSVIINSRALKDAIIQRYYDSHYEHVGVLIDYLCSKEQINVVFNPNILLIYLMDDGDYRQKYSGWRHVPFYVWGRCWSQMILSLPFKIPYDLKIKVIKDHERKYHWFSIKNLIKNKIRFGEPYVKNYKENRQFVKMVTVASPLLTDLIMYLPIEPIFKILIALKNRIKRH